VYNNPYLFNCYYFMKEVSDGILIIVGQYSSQ
jgi:hypothetical protein